MLSVRNWGNKSTLALGITATDDYITLAPGAEQLFPISTGEHFYLTLRTETKREVVLVTGGVGRQRQVERGQDGTAIQSFPAGTCIEVEWNPAQLREFVASVRCGTEVTGVSPGTYCLGCTTCITVNAAGQVVSINGSEGC